MSQAVQSFEGMKFETVKRTADIQIPGIAVTATTVDGNLKELRLAIPGGQTYLIRGAIYGNSIEVARVAAPKLVTRYRLVATIGARDVELSEHESSYEATLAQQALKGIEADLCRIEEVQVPEE